ncbi:NAD(P)-dependent oxidoreductase [Pseudomarimonas salicorniae]|uniref:NAD(P)-dependent oxidoreductase n=1 Tax=Pseudomarimonas salicorniae TaxID=2933270 RepID=A0ABT0GDA3_9GAMM|nr:NAD(P)-dependent oxidoreductase [Lysobacter sp. CAU 1642]MCK7592522.1 NAD(P)-dependent oxidoreductase [Lysobacter sp. CAU 1642]
MAQAEAGFIGLGAMGGPMAGHLAAAGRLAVVGNRSPGRVVEWSRKLEVKGATTAADFGSCSVIMLCVGEDHDVLENVDALGRVLAAGSLVIDHSTTSVEAAREAGRRLAAHDIDFLDAPVSGGVEGARNGRLSVMVGGTAEVLARAEPFLSCYAARIAHMGGQGSGQATKAVNQVMVAGINEAVSEALALGEKLGLAAEDLLPTLMAGAAGNWFLDKRGGTMMRSEFNPGFKCAHMAKDLRIAEAMAGSLGIAHPVLAQARRDYELLQGHGHGDLDTSALILLKRTAGRD